MSSIGVKQLSVRGERRGGFGRVLDSWGRSRLARPSRTRVSVYRPGQCMWEARVRRAGGAARGTRPRSSLSPPLTGRRGPGRTHSIPYLLEHTLCSTPRCRVESSRPAEQSRSEPAGVRGVTLCALRAPRYLITLCHSIACSVRSAGDTYTLAHPRSTAATSSERFGALGPLVRLRRRSVLVLAGWLDGPVYPV